MIFITQNNNKSQRKQEKSMKRLILVVLFTAVALGTAACSGGGSGELEVQDVWGRNSPKAATNAAFYMTIVNNTGEDEQLLGGSVDLCGVVELHEMYDKGNDVMGMRQVPGGVIDIPAGETVELKVGGLHVMCIGKDRALEIGEEIPITLTFANAGDVAVTAEIREGAMGN